MVCNVFGDLVCMKIVYCLVSFGEKNCFVFEVDYIFKFILFYYIKIFCEVGLIQFCIEGKQYFYFL